MANQAPPHYQYRPLDAENEIRVLVLEPASNFADPLIGNLITRPIWKAEATHIPPYEAVSYCWGSLHPSQLILCDGRDLPVTENVDAFLRHLRKASRTRNLWIDALCINQSNIKEKERQVRNMGTIFSHADKVHVWLGEATEADQIPVTFAFLKEKVLAKEHSYTFNQSRQKTVLLASFLSRPWFRRRWVIQEVALSHAVTIRCGQHKLSWNWVRDSVDVLYTELAKDNDVLPLEAIHALENAANLRPGTESILELLFRCHSSECQDHRDRLFSMYSIVSKQSQAILDPYLCCPPDYLNDWTLTYTLFAASVVEVGLLYDLFEHAIAFGTLSQQDPSWPSWSRSRFGAGSVQDPRKYAPYVVWSENRPGLRIKGIVSEVELPRAITLEEFATFPGEERTMTSQIRFLFRVLAPQANDDDEAKTKRERLLRAVIQTLVTALHDTQLFYRGRKFDFDRIFLNTDVAVSKLFGRADATRFDLLSNTLLIHFGLYRTPKHYYEKNVLVQEIDATLNGYTLVQVDDSNDFIPAIVPPEFKSGDLIFRPRGMDSKPLGFTFYLRPYETSTVVNQDATCLKCRLAGACILGNTWLTQPRRADIGPNESVFKEVILV